MASSQVEREFTEEFFKRFPNVRAEVCYDKDWDDILRWFEQSGVTHYGIYENSSRWGNYLRDPKEAKIHSMIKTGEYEGFTRCGINNFTGNTSSLVQHNNYKGEELN